MKLLRSLAALLVVSLGVSRADAQCLTPDNLDVGGACGNTTTFLPQRGFGQQSMGICFDNCSVAATANYQVKWGNALPFNLGSPPGTVPSCGWYQATLLIQNGSSLAWSGTLHMSYSRTWLEAVVPGTVSQVWRYLVNGDLKSLTPSGFPCGSPNCAPSTGGLVRFTGYIDYMRDCGSGVVSQAWMLMHACDGIDHALGFPRAGSFHPNRSYAFVGPAAGFVPGAGSTLEAGPVSQEGMRAWDVLALPARCKTEEPLLGGAINPSAPVCMCGTGPAAWHQGQFVLGGAFGATLNPFPGSDPFRSFPIGMWTNPTAFPGVEEVRFSCNEGQWVECTGAGRQEYYFGVTTAGGFPAYSFNGASAPMPLPQTFVDQCNSVLLPANVATRNQPYYSDHIVNVNL